MIVLSTCLVVTAAAVGCGSDPTGTGGDEDSGTGTDTGIKTDSGPKVDSGTPDSGPAPTYTVSASIVGLKGAGLVLQDKSGGTVAVTAKAGATQTVTILSKVPAQTAFDISVKTQPGEPAQNCVVAGGKGTVVAGDVTSITVNCTDLYTVGGTVIGLDGKDLILENTSGGATDDVTLNMNGTFAFPKPLLAGSTYSVSVKQSPTANWQTCTISAAAGDAGADGGDAGGGDAGGGITGNVTNIVVNCKTNTYPVSVKVTGLDVASTGAVFQNSGADNLLVKTNATVPFATEVASGANYDVKVFTQPTAPWQTCTVTNGGPVKVTNAPVVLDVACATNTYKIGGTLAGLKGNGLVLQDNAGDDLTLNAANNGAFAFATKVASGKPYAVTVKTQPNGVAGEKCTASVATGTVAGVDVTTVKVNCVAYRTKVMVCTSSGRSPSTFTTPGVNFVVSNNCTPDSDTQAFFVTRNGVNSFVAATVKAYVEAGGIALTEYTANAKVFNAVFGTAVADGSNQGSCTDDIPSVFQYNVNDPF